MERIYDVIGVGFGPANIAVAVAAEELHPEMDIHFIEAKDETQWQPDMMLSGADIQNNPLRDLVTPRNPRSYYSFVNFLKEKGRLFDHLNLGVNFPLRAEYNQYVQWVASAFVGKVSYGKSIADVRPVYECGEHCGYEAVTACGERFRARSVIFAPGRTPYLPKVLDDAGSDKIFHFNTLLTQLFNADKNGADIGRIAIVGSSQSAVEIALYLRQRYPEADITNLIRNFGIRQKDLSPFTGEVFYPEYATYYHNASQNAKKALDQDLRYTNYSAADSDVLDQLYLAMYEDKIAGIKRHRIMRNTIIESAEITDNQQIILELVERHTGEHSNEVFDLVISATGFRDIGPGDHQEKVPAVLKSVEPWLIKDELGCVTIGSEYELPLSIKLSAACPLVLNGLCEKSHGMGDAGSFSLLSLRSEQILNHITGCLAPVSVHLAG